MTMSQKPHATRQGVKFASDYVGSREDSADQTASQQATADMLDAVAYGNARIAEYSLSDTVAIIGNGSAMLLLDARGKILASVGYGSSEWDSPWLAAACLVAKLDCRLRAILL
jgi:hypothetical protein